MGIYGITRNNNNIKETWEYFGNIEYNGIIYKELSGKIYIKENNGKNEIQIEGKIKKSNEKFSYTGIESNRYIKGENNISYRIQHKNFQKDIIIIKLNEGNQKLIGEFVGKNNDIYQLTLELYLPKKKKEKSFSVISNQFQSKLSKLKIPEDILVNSLCGMKNLINTCYINSSFQILIHIPQFVKLIRRNKDFENNIIGDINSIFNKILGCYKEYKPIINPSNFVKNFKSQHSEYNNNFQMDSEMFLEDLLWDINLELGTLCEKRKDIFYNNINNKQKEFLNYIKESEEDTHYEINDLFYVYFVHEKKCEACNFISYYYDETPGLKLNFEKTKYRNSIDLHTLIMDNFKTSIRIKSSLLCKNCKKCFYLKETTRIAKLPKILILSLQRTNNNNTKKIPWIVKYGKELGIKEIVDIDLSIYESGLYSIFAINNHLGSSPKSGHYYSTIFLEKLENWFTFNDESVEQISNFIPTLNNYILFYKQK